MVQLSNAEKLIGGLGGEEKRWTDTVASLTLAMDKLPGECSAVNLPNIPTRQFAPNAPDYEHANKCTNLLLQLLTRLRWKSCCWSQA